MLPSLDKTFSLDKPRYLHKPSTLLTLPAELRNYIWELAFTPNSSGSPWFGHDDVNLLDARAPDKALLLTCRQTYNEARGMYILARTQFWQGTRFFICCGAQTGQTAFAEFCNRLDAIDEDTVGRINHLSIYRTSGFSRLPSLEMRRRLWVLTLPLSGRSQSIDRVYWGVVTPEFKRQLYAGGVPVKNIPPNAHLAPPGKTWPLACSWYSTYAADPFRAHGERFDFMFADCSEYNEFIFGVARDCMDQDKLTKMEMRAMLSYHLLQPYVLG